MHEIMDTHRKRICVGISRSGRVGGIYEKSYKIYNAESDTCEDIKEDDIKNMLKDNTDIVNLTLSERGAVQCTYTDKDKLECHCLTVVGIVNESRTNKNIIGYDVVVNDGTKMFLEAEHVYDKAWADIVRNMEVEYRGSTAHRYKNGGAPLYVRYTGEDSDKCDEQAVLSRLKSQLIEVLTQMDKIRPVQFHDADCDDCLYNFSDVVIDETDDRVYIEIAMWHDNLPAHAKNPLKDGRGRAIPPKKRS